MKRSMTRGFTLIEVMIVVAILGIIASIAYPSYINQVRKVRRSDAQAALSDLAQRMERCFSESLVYNNVGCEATVSIGGGLVSDEGWYNITLVTANGTFTLTATPLLDQLTGDTKCGTLGLNQAGQKTKSGTETVQDCW